MDYTFAIIENAAQVRIGGKQTHRINSEYARWFDECTSIPGTYAAKLMIPTCPFDTALPFLIVDWDGLITSCNWEPCYGGVPFGAGTDNRGKPMKGQTRIDLLKALGDKRVTWANLRGHLEAMEQRCVMVLGRLTDRLNGCVNSIERDEMHMVGHYAEGIQEVVEVIEAIRRVRNQAIYDERRVA